jgi:hypothetical protein
MIYIIYRFEMKLAIRMLISSPEWIRTTVAGSKGQHDCPLQHGAINRFSPGKCLNRLYT